MVPGSWLRRGPEEPLWEGASKFRLRPALSPQGHAPCALAISPQGRAPCAPAISPPREAWARGRTSGQPSAGQGDLRGSELLHRVKAERLAQDPNPHSPPQKETCHLGHTCPVSSVLEVGGTPLGVLQF